MRSQSARDNAKPEERPRYTAELIYDWETFSVRCTELRRNAPSLSAQPFQTTFWLSAWYRAFVNEGQITPLWVALRDGKNGQDAMLLPLIKRRRHGLTTIEFADLSVSDRNAPLMAPRDAHADPINSADMWRALAPILRQADAVRFLKMPYHLGDELNPLTVSSAAAASTLTTWKLSLGASWQQYFGSLPRAKRKEIGRSGRLLETAGCARFVRAQSCPEAYSLLTVIHAIQCANLDEAGESHPFHYPHVQAFYRDVVQGVESGQAFVTALELDGNIVAGMAGILVNDHAVFLRLCSKRGPLAYIGLGRLVMQYTMQTLHADGTRVFDFSIGEGAHKRMFMATAEGLCNVVFASTWLGRAYLGALRLRDSLQSAIEKRRKPAV